MWIICAYYTKDTAYAEYAKTFTKSLQKFSLLHDVVGVDSKGDWYANMQHKPTFLKQMLEKHHPNSVVYIDVDAEVCRYPTYFDTMDSNPEVNIAVHLLDHSKYRRKDRPSELLSGTIFLKNTTIANQIVEKWIQECKKNPHLWDQRALKTVLEKYDYRLLPEELLPEEYCVIFDYMTSVENPVIKHFQASREYRRGCIRKPRHGSVPRIIARGRTR